jgi:hypothetical protein
MSIYQLTQKIRQRHTSAKAANSANKSEVKIKTLAELATLADNTTTADNTDLMQPMDREDTRRCCYQCSNLSISGQCLAAKRGELLHVARGYRPITNTLQRCECYLPRNLTEGIWIENKSEANPFDQFFNTAEQAGILLLKDDKQWLKSIGFTRICDELLEQYLQHWKEAMQAEKVKHKKQNKGRFSANTWLRTTLANQHIS